MTRIKLVCFLKGGEIMFWFNYEEGAGFISVWLVWICVLLILFLLNEVTRRFKVAGIVGFMVLPVVLSVLWFTVMKETTYTDWFHLAKVYSATAGCIGFWCMFAQTFPLFQDFGVWRVDSTYNPTIYFIVSFLSLAVNIGVVVYMIYKWKKTKRNPYKGELYTDLREYQSIAALAE